jgi:hypothetical protein
VAWSAAQGAARPVLVVVRNVFCEHYSQAAFAVDEQVVGALAAQGADPAFADRVGPWRLDRSLDDLDVIGLEDGIEAGGVLGVSVRIRNRTEF